MAETPAETPPVYQGIYVNPSDCTDPALKVKINHCKDADEQIGVALLAMGLTVAEIAALTLPNPALTGIGRAMASASAALEAARGDDSAMMGKHKAYADKARALTAQLTRRVLGISLPTGGGAGSIEIGRG
jgi:hypothetical protein